MHYYVNSHRRSAHCHVTILKLLYLGKEVSKSEKGLKCYMSEHLHMPMTVDKCGLLMICFMV